MQRGVDRVAAASAAAIAEQRPMAATASQLMVVATTAAATATAVAIAMQQAVQRGTRYIVSNGKSGNRRQSKCFFSNKATIKLR